MEGLNNYALVAEILSAITIMAGTMFAIFQFREHKKQLGEQVAAEMCRKFAEPDMGRAVTLVKRLPDDISLEALQAMDREYEEAIHIVAMAFETMGLLVHRKIASFGMIQQLTGGLVLMIWRKSRVWIRETREAAGNPRFGEWGEWLAIQLENREKQMVPAYKAYADWRV